MRKPNCSLRELLAKRSEEIEREEREQREQEAHQVPLRMDMQWPTATHQQHILAANQEHQMQMAQIEQERQLQKLQDMQEFPPPSDVEIARGQLRNARSLLLGTHQHQRKRH